ncbi:MAG TPA: type II toxin-antitoxin system PemK/MazF family toxin [Chloroflexota bacterium]
MAQRQDIVLARFPFTDQSQAKLRPVLVLAEVPGPYRDYVAMFISSQLNQAAPGDIILRPSDAAFAASGLKAPSVFRVGKVATISEALLVGTLGRLDDATFRAVIARLIELLEGRQRTD